MNSLAFHARRAVASDGRPLSSRQGSSIVELVVAVAVILVGLLAFSRSLGGAMALGEENRQTALATAAAQRIVEELYAADLARVFALYNEFPDDDPDGPGTAPGATFTVAGLESDGEDGALRGEILFPVSEDGTGELRERDSKLRLTQDLDLDGVVDEDDHSGDYRVLPVRVRVAWRDGREERELVVTTILGAR